MKVGDLVRCRERSPEESYDDWLGLIIAEPPLAKTVQWIYCRVGSETETVNHSPEELVLVNENR